MKRIIALLLALYMSCALICVPAAAEDLSSRLLAEYNFDNETTNDSVGAKDATLYNNAEAATGTYAEGVSGKALKLSAKGTDEKFWLSIPYSVFGDNRDSFTLSMWYKSSDYNTSGEDSELFSLYNSSAEKFLFYAPALTGNTNMGYTMKWDGTYGYANVISPYVQNEWQHIVYVVSNDGNKTGIQAYINGEKVTVDQGGSWDNSLMSLLGIDTFTIGGKNPYKGGATPSCLFYGSVDEVRIYSGVLNATEAKSLYTGTEYKPAERGTLLAEYNFDEENTKDAIGTNDASFYDNSRPVDADYIDGVSGKALRLSEKGTAEKFWLSVPIEAFGANLDDFTISMWYNAQGYNETGECSELFTLYNQSKEKFLFYCPVLNDNIGFTMKWDGTYGYANVITPYQPNEWVHLVYSVSNDGNRSIITAYINGEKVEVDQGGEWGNSLLSMLGVTNFTIGGKNPYKGGNTPACLFYGAVDEVRLYSGTLTAAEAAAIYDEVANAPAERGTLLAEYNFDEQNTEDCIGTNDAVFYDDLTATDAEYIDGVSGKALRLSEKGTDEKFWLSVPYSAFGGNRDSFSLSLWYNAADYNTEGEDSELFSLYNGAEEKFIYYSPAATAFTDKAFTMKWDGTYGYANVITPCRQNEWVHLVFCVDAAEGQSRITAYLNGKAVEVDQGGEWADSLMSTLGIDNFTIGGQNPYKGGASPKCSFYGAVDEIRLYAGVLTQEEANSIFCENHTHTYTDTVIDPTCTEQGYTEHTCNCGDVMQDTFVEALGHDWDDGEVQKEMTATEDGLILYTCLRCGETKEEVIPSPMHEHAYTAVVTAPTCTEDGYTTYTCSCGDSYVDNYTEALGHAPVTDPATPATCLEDGKSEGSHCERCGEIFTVQETIPALGHNIVTLTAVEPTCTEAGKTEGRACDRCDYVETKQRELPALGHKYDAVVTKEATEEAEGEKSLTCTRCGDTLTQSIDKLICPSAGYTDIKRTAWYHAAADFVIERGIMGSTKTDALTFEPATDCTRSMIVMILYNIAGTPDVSYVAKFPDVKDNQWYTNAVMWAYQNGVVSGYNNGNFGPNDKITREQMAVLLKSYAEWCGKDTSKRTDLSVFPDGSKAKWSKEAVQWAVAEGLINGKAQGGKTYLDPQGNASRSEVAALIMGFMQKILTEDQPAWMDDGELKVLAIGNSFADDTLWNSYEIAKGLGIEKINVEILYIGGCNIMKHWENAQNDAPAYEYRQWNGSAWDTTKNYKMSDAIKSDNWDFIIFSNGNSYGGSQLIPSTYADLPKLTAYVRDLCGEKTKFVFNATWADASYSDFAYMQYWDTTPYRDNIDLMWKDLASATWEGVKPEADISQIVPTGAAIQNTSHLLGVFFWEADGHHLNHDGDTVAGLMMLCSLSGISPDGFTCSEELLPAAWQEPIRTAVHNALVSPIEILN